VSDQAVDHECPVDVGHSARRGALGQAKEGALYLARRRLTVGGAVEPVNESVVSFEIRLHDRRHAGALVRKRIRRRTGLASKIRAVEFERYKGSTQARDAAGRIYEVQHFVMLHDGEEGAPFYRLPDGMPAVRVGDDEFEIGILDKFRVKVM
jgi:hypothetical protein